VNLPLDTDNVTFVDLPAEDDFIQTPLITSRNYWDIKYDETLFLPYDLTLPTCSSFDFTGTTNIVGILGGTNTQVLYGRYIELEENTLDAPIPSGGADLEVCSNAMMDWNNAESCHVSNDPNACNSNVYEILDNDKVTVVCGSPGEIANDPFGQSIFHLAYTTKLKGNDNFSLQKQSVWSMVAIDQNTTDQLRQRVAWALSQILVISPNQIENEEFSEIYLHYYDIFVKVSAPD
jgi:hypothetical protein